MDVIFIMHSLNNAIQNFMRTTKTVHTKKLNKLGIQQPNFDFANDAICNLSSYALSKKRKVLAVIGTGIWLT